MKKLLLISSIFLASCAPLPPQEKFYTDAYEIIETQRLAGSITSYITTMKHKKSGYCLAMIAVPNGVTMMPMPKEACE